MPFFRFFDSFWVVGAAHFGNLQTGNANKKLQAASNKLQAVEPPAGGVIEKRN
jgi:hypothetical protein